MSLDPLPNIRLRHLPLLNRPVVVYVCLDCGAWASEMSNLHPNYSRCEEDGHRRAYAVPFMLIGQPYDPMGLVPDARST